MIVITKWGFYVKNNGYPLLLLSFCLIISGCQFTDSITQKQENGLRIMTYNIRYINNNDVTPHTWEERLPLIEHVIKKYNPGIIGTQEAIRQQIKDLDESLTNYAWIGVGREGGENGEYAAIFYNKDRFKVLESENLWLSDTPNVEGSRTWGNKIPRMVTWGKFLDENAKQEFYFMNTHFDHQSVESRIDSAEFIIKQTGEFKLGVPIILTGDFNSKPRSLPYNILTAENGFVDLWGEVEGTENENIGTLNQFGIPNGGGPEYRIDWILAKGNIRAKSIQIIDYKKDNQYPSDHFPVITELSLSD